MNRCDIVAKLHRLLPCDSDPLLNVLVRLLLNLSFDEAIRKKIIEQGFIPDLVDLLTSSRVRGVAPC